MLYLFCLFLLRPLPLEKSFLKGLERSVLVRECVRGNDMNHVTLLMKKCVNGVSVYSIRETRVFDKNNHKVRITECTRTVLCPRVFYPHWYT